MTDIPHECRLRELEAHIVTYRAQVDAVLKDRAMIIAERDRIFAVMLERADTADAAEARVALLEKEASSLIHSRAHFRTSASQQKARCHKLRHRQRALISALENVKQSKSIDQAKLAAHIGIGGWSDDELVYQLRDHDKTRAGAADAEVASLRAQIDAKDADLKHSMDSNEALVVEVDRLKQEAALPAHAPGVWHQGEPPKPWRQEWFIAQTIHGDRVVLCALPEEYTYDYMTADHTYMIAGNITRWMQFPDSEFIAPTPSRDDVLEEAAKRFDWECGLVAGHKIAAAIRAMKGEGK